VGVKSHVENPLGDDVAESCLDVVASTFSRAIPPARPLSVGERTVGWAGRMAAPTTEPGQITKIFIRNYKSLAEAAIELPMFCVLVGPNGVGKSNFIDALAFVKDSLGESMDLAFKKRGGQSAVRRRSGGHPTHLGIQLVMTLPGQGRALYAFEVAAKASGRFEISRERCEVEQLFEQPQAFEVRDGAFTIEIPGISPKIAPDRLALFAASSVEPYRHVFDFLTGIETYSIVPDLMRIPQPPDAGHSLRRDGSNAAAVLKRIRDERRDTYERICSLLEKTVEGLAAVDYRAVAGRDTLEFRQDVGQKNPWRFPASNVSDGTLRMLGLLLAVYQIDRPSVVAIEEPEATVHPGAAEIITQVLVDASQDCQVVITTHSADLLDFNYIRDSALRVVAKDRNSTLIGPMDESGRHAVKEELFTPGELLRAREIDVDREATEAAADQSSLFAMPVAEG
jgi:predicted ATPase